LASSWFASETLFYLLLLLSEFYPKLLWLVLFCLFTKIKPSVVFRFWEFLRYFVLNRENEFVFWYIDASFILSSALTLEKGFCCILILRGVYDENICDFWTAWSLFENLATDFWVDYLGLGGLILSYFLMNLPAEASIVYISSMLMLLSASSP